MHPELDAVINRYGTDCLKWDYMEKWLGVPEGEALPSWVSDWDFKAPDFILKPLQERLDHGIFGYSERSEEYFNSLIDWWRERHQVTLQKDWFHTTPGSLPAIAMLIESWSQQHDQVLVMSPVYHAFFRTITNTQRTLVTSSLVNDNGYYTIDFDDLEEKFKAGVKVMIFCNPHNPVGRVWTEQEVTRVCQLCNQYDVYLISDEIWADIDFSEHRFFSCLRVDNALQQKMAVCIAGTKTFGLPSLRLTNTMIPNNQVATPFKNKLQAYGIDVYSAFSLVANQAAYRDGADWVDQTVGYLNENSRILDEFIKAELPHIIYRRQESTYLAWLDCRSLGLSDDVLEKKVHDAGVIPSMGYAFGEDGKGFIRLNLGCPKSVLEEKLVRLKTALA
ncbi:MalY/PatB family protein [Endozoicomonas ascidiicola]|uniref:MalY/PatB family protein n=1 Tax=Endozoicomonas ascidiicola TaxID=1698521 RepID=UPI000831EDF4|nr:MalY/PatB family protein [Endozoicomonas ascidiicola]